MQKLLYWIYCDFCVANTNVGVFVPQSNQQEEELALNNTGMPRGELENSHDLAIFPVTSTLHPAVPRARCPRRKLRWEQICAGRALPGSGLWLGTQAGWGRATWPCWCGGWRLWRAAVPGSVRGQHAAPERISPALPAGSGALPPGHTGGTRGCKQKPQSLVEGSLASPVAVQT